MILGHWDTWALGHIDTLTHFDTLTLGHSENTWTLGHLDTLGHLVEKNLKFRKLEKMTTFTKPSEKIVNEWKKYQKRFGKQDAVDRVQRMKLDQICKPEHKLVDIGCNDGYITQLIAPMVASATGVEPHVELPNTNTVNWIKQTFNEFVQNNTKKYDKPRSNSKRKNVRKDNPKPPTLRN